MWTLLLLACSSAPTAPAPSVALASSPPEPIAPAAPRVRGHNPAVATADRTCAVDTDCEGVLVKCCGADAVAVNVASAQAVRDGVDPDPCASMRCRLSVVPPAVCLEGTCAIEPGFNAAAANAFTGCQTVDDCAVVASRCCGHDPVAVNVSSADTVRAGVDAQPCANKKCALPQLPEAECFERRCVLQSDAPALVSDPSYQRCGRDGDCTAELDCAGTEHPVNSMGAIALRALVKRSAGCTAREGRRRQTRCERLRCVWK